MGNFFDTPRSRRLRSDYEAMKRLKEESNIMDFQAFGDPAERYLVTLKGRGLMRKSEGEPVEMAEVHRVEIRLGIDYPRSRPDLQWLTQIYHPNISGVGAVCLGGYSTDWVPSLSLDELSTMLWDMVRYENYDPKSAYNYAAGRWSEQQAQFDFPIDKRSIRDKLQKTVGDNIISFRDPSKAPPPVTVPEPPPIVAPKVDDDILIIDDATPAPVVRRMPPPPPPRPRPAADDDILIIE